MMTFAGAEYVTAHSRPLHIYSMSHTFYLDNTETKASWFCSPLIKFQFACISQQMQQMQHYAALHMHDLAFNSHYSLHETSHTFRTGSCMAAR
jgi:hypothetical protein